jgi:hypothetical protein
MLVLPFVPMVLICLHLSLLEHLIIQLLPKCTARTGIEAISRLPEASAEAKQRKRKSRESDIFPGTPHKTLIESKERGKARNMNGRAERQLQELEAVQKKFRKSKVGQGEN